MGLKIGGRAKVVRKVNRHGAGTGLHIMWDDDWMGDMDKTIGKEFTIIDYDDTLGYKLNTGTLCGESYNYNYPPEALESVDENPEEKPLENTVTGTLMPAGMIVPTGMTVPTAEEIKSFSKDFPSTYFSIEDGGIKVYYYDAVYDCEDNKAVLEVMNCIRQLEQFRSKGV